MSSFTRLGIFCGAAASGFILPQAFWRWGHIDSTNRRGFTAAEADARSHGSGFVGNWRMVTGYTPEMEAIMVQLGTPKYVQRLDQLGFDTHMRVDVEKENLLVENITKFNGLYNREVKLFMDGCIRVEHHPIDGSKIHAASYWQTVREVPGEQDRMYEVVGASGEAMNDKVSVAAVSDIYYEKYAKRHRVMRILENEGNTLHVVHALRSDTGASDALFSHRYLERVDGDVSEE